MIQLKIPAISHELEFIATHLEEASDIWDGNIKIDPLLKQLSDTVYVRAEKDAAELLDQLKDTIAQGAKGFFRINNWHRSGVWEVYSEIYWGMKGRKKSVGWVGLHVGHGKEGFRLFAYINPRRGGLDGRRKFALACKKKIEQVHLTRDDQKRYANWNDCIIWFEKKLTLQTSREELRTEITKQAKKFVAVAKPLLRGA
jgi:hypothetical protein